MDIQDLFKIIDTTLGVKPQELIKYTNAEQLQTYEEKRHQHVWEQIKNYQI